MSLSTLTISPGGINDSMKGPEYQKKFMVLFACNATHANLDFELSTEIHQAGKFDDLVFLYRDSTGKAHVRLLQAKHRIKPVTMNLNSLLVDNDFCLHKYCISFKSIQTNLKEEIDDVILATNNNFKNSTADADTLALNMRNKNIAISVNLTRMKDIDPCLDNFQHRYKFENSGPNFDFLKNYLLAYELAFCIFGDDSIKLNEENCSVLLHYRKFVESNIIDVTSKCFRTNLFVTTDTSLEEFKKIFQTIMDEAKNSKKCKIKNKFDKSQSKSIWNYLEEKSAECCSNLLKLFKDQVDEDALVENELQMDKSIKEFLEKFVFLVDVDMNSIEDTTIKCLKEKFRFENYQTYLGVLETNITKWISHDGKMKTSIINHQKSDISQTFVKNSFGETEAISVCDRSAEKFMEFRNLEFTPDSLDSISSLITETGITVLETSREGSILTCWEICQQIRQSGELLIFLQSDDSYDILTKAVRTFESCVNYCLINAISDSYSIPEDFIRIAKKTTKRLIVVTQQVNSQLSNYKNKKISPTVWKDLTPPSQSKLLDRFVKFQNNDVQLRDLIDNFKEDQEVWKILNFNSIAPNTFINNCDSNMYLERTIQRKINLKWSLLKDIEYRRFQEQVVFTEEEFNKFCKDKKNKGRTVHWLMKNEDTEKLSWIRTEHGISELRKYIEENNYDNLTEDKFLSTHSKTNVIVDSAGMGKTWLLRNLAEKVREQHKDHWIIKVDLNSFSDAFNENENLRGLDFIKDHVLKLKEDSDITVFNHSYESSGKIIIFFDGFDEVARLYQNTVLSIIAYWVRDTQAKCFIATRPEWKETLENRFSTFSCSFIAFTEEDKKNFLGRKWKNSFDHLFKKDELSQVISNVLENSSMKISQKEKSFTGTPLIMKLLSEYFEDKINSEKLKYKDPSELISQLKTQNYNLFVLYEKFVWKMIERHLGEKQAISLTVQGNIDILETRQKSLNELHRRFAVSQIFNETLLGKLPDQLKKPLDEKEITELVNCGIITKTNDKFTFLHFTFIEYFVAGALIENLKDDNFIEFLLHEILSKEKGYEVIQMFLNHSFNSFKDQPIKKIYEIMNRKKDSVIAFHIACKQNNSNTFEFLFKSLFQDPDGILRKWNLKKILNYEFNKFILHFYFKFCEVSIEILDKVKFVFGSKFVKSTLLHRSGFWVKHNVLIASTKHETNYVKLFEWIFNNFPNDKKFLKRIFRSVDNYGNGILHFALQNYSSETFPKFWNVLKGIESVVNKKLSHKLIMHKDKFQGTILYLRSFGNPNLNFTEILELLKTEISDIEILKSLLLSVDKELNSLLHNLFKNCSQANCFKHFTEICNFIKIEFGVETLEEILLIENDHKNVFFNRILFNPNMKNNEKSLLITMIKSCNWIVTEVGRDVTKQLFNNFRGDLKEFLRRSSSEDTRWRSTSGLISLIKMELDGEIYDEFLTL